jgi:hypothetical protein
MKRLQFVLLSVVCLAAVSARAAPAASDQVRRLLTEALRGQIKQLIAASLSKAPAGVALTKEQLDHQTDALLQQALVRYSGNFTLRETDAQSLLNKGPNDAGNLAAIKNNWEVYKKIVLPLPVLMKRLHDQVAAGAISGGWDLELARRISDAHLTDVTDAERRYEEAQKAHP